MTVEYSKLNSIVLAQLPHHARLGGLNVVTVEADGYPQETSAKQAVGKDEGGRTIWQPVMCWRGLDKRVVKGHREKYNGTNLRAIRAKKGVGRPWLTLL